MEDKSQALSRRALLRRAMAFGAAGVGAVGMTEETCRRTPPQMEGPFYPVADIGRDADLVSLVPGGAEAEGQKIRIVGRVQDEACRPVMGAHVEIWQACLSGKYDHPDDTSTNSLDPAFQYWGRAVTDTNGQYAFRTIVPGAYLAAPGRYRPPHIHYKVKARGFRPLTTQLYFDPNGIEDRALAEMARRWNAFERVPKDLVVTLDRGVGAFPITLLRAPATWWTGSPRRPCPSERRSELR
jgi:protocatechuate 3,4-dioxygenase beta subunit